MDLMFHRCRSSQITSMLADDRVMLQEQVPVLFLDFFWYAVNTSDVIIDELLLCVGQRPQLFIAGFSLRAFLLMEWILAISWI